MNPESFQQAPWGAPIAIYFTLAGVIAGLPLLLPVIANAAAPRQVERLKARTFFVCAALIGLASLLLVLDLGRPERFFLMMSEFSRTSPISVGAKLIALDGYLAVVLWFSYRSVITARAKGDCTALERPTSWFLTAVEGLAFATSLAIACYPAFVAGMSYHLPLASLPGTTIAFLASALIMGLGGLTMTASSARLAGSLAQARVRRATIAMVCVHSVLLVGIGVTALIRDHGRASRLVEHAPFGLAALGLLALILPVAGAAIPREGRAASFAAGTLLLVGGASARLAFFMGS